MEERLKELLERYWEGESSVEEEQEMKNLLTQINGYEAEKEFFLGLSELKQMEPRPQKGLPDVRRLGNWWKVAAMLLFFLGINMIYRQYQKQRIEEQTLAYIQVMDAFTLIRQNMQQGKEELTVLEDFRYLGTPNQIFNLTETKNE